MGERSDEQREAEGQAPPSMSFVSSSKVFFSQTWLLKMALYDSRTDVPMNAAIHIEKELD